MNIIKQKANILTSFLTKIFFPECPKINKDGREKAVIGENWQTSTCQIPGLEGNITKMFVS